MYKSIAINIFVWGLLFALPKIIPVELDLRNETAIQQAAKEAQLRLEREKEQFYGIGQKPERKPIPWNASVHETFSVQSLPESGDLSLTGLSSDRSRVISEAESPFTDTKAYWGKDAQDAAPILRTVSDLPAGRSAIVKMDWDLPPSPSGLDPTKIYRTFPTLHALMAKYERLFLVLTFGRPETGRPDEEYSIDRVLDVARPVLKSEGIDAEVIRLPWELAEADEIIARTEGSSQASKRIYVFENMHFYRDESDGSRSVRKDFAHRLKELSGADVFVNESLESLADLWVSSTHELARLFEPEKRAAGFFFESEVFKLSFFEYRLKGGPVLYIFGGEDWGELEHALTLVRSSNFKRNDRLAVIGTLAYPLLDALGYSVGRSRMPTETERIRHGLDSTLRGLADFAQKHPEALILPEDHVAEGDVRLETLPARDIAQDFEATSIGTRTLNALEEQIERVRTAGDGGIVFVGTAGRIDLRLSRQWGTTALVKKLEEAALLGQVPVLFAGHKTQRAIRIIEREDRQGNPLSREVLRSYAAGSVFANGVGQVETAQVLLKGVFQQSGTLSQDRSILNRPELPQTEILSGLFDLAPALKNLREAFQQVSSNRFHAQRLKRAVERQSANVHISMVERALLEREARAVLDAALASISIVVGDSARSAAQGMQELKMLEDLVGTDRVFTLTDYRAGKAGTARVLFVLTADEQKALNMTDLAIDSAHRTKGFEELRIVRYEDSLLSSFQSPDQAAPDIEDLDALAALVHSATEFVRDTNFFIIHRTR